MNTWIRLITCFVVMLTPAFAQAQGQSDPSNVLLRPPELLDTGTPSPITSKVHAGAKMLGQWQWSTKHGLRPSQDTTEKNSFWVPALTHPTNPHYHKTYTIRAELILGKRPDSSFFFKATFPEDLARVTGYSLTFDHRKVLFHRWDEGYPTPVTSAVSLPDATKRIRFYIGTFSNKTRAFITDAETGTPLAKLEMYDHTVDGAQIGYRVYQKQDKVTALTALDITKDANAFVKTKVFDPDAYLRHIPTSYVIAPAKKLSPVLAQCSKLKHTTQPGYHVYRCTHDVMMQLVKEGWKLPDGYFWAEPRNSFTDDEYRKVSHDLSCPVPMHCQPDAALDPNRSAKDVNMIQAYLDAYVPVCQKKIAHVRLETLGRTYLGYPIRAIVLSNAPTTHPQPRILFNGAHHGMELFASDMAFDVLEQLCESDDADKRKLYDDALSKVEVWIIPTVNLDGNDLFFHVSQKHLGRKNGRHVFVDSAGTAFPKTVGPYDPRSAYYRYRPNGIAAGAGVDINRNYPLRWGATGELSSSARPRDYWYRGKAPASEPETQTMMHMFHSEQFAASISFHTVSTKILSPYSIDALENPPHDEDHAWQLASRMAEAAGMQPSGKPYQVVKNLYSVDGTDQDWFRMIAGTYAYLIEGALHNPTGKKRRDALTRTRPTWETLLDASRYATIVRVRDEEGQPVIAEVSYSDVAQLNGEHWMTRCQDGTHAMLCFGPRTITVRFPDKTTQSRQVPCTDTPTLVDFTFEAQQTHAPSTFFCASGICETLTAIDTLCALRNNVCPTYPANRYCLIDNVCVQEGTPNPDAAPDAMTYCHPAENNRGWSPSP